MQFLGSWSYKQSEICLLAEQDIHTSIILPLPLNVILMERQDVTYCPPFRYVFSSLFFCHGIVHFYIVICNIELTAIY